MNFVMPDGVEEYPDDILDILNRIPVGWGRWISCDKGWYKLLVDTNRKMNMMWPNYEIHQVKEKFGRLCMYNNTNTDYVNGVLDMADAMVQQLDKKKKINRIF